MTIALSQGTQDAQLFYHAGIIERSQGHADIADQFPRQGVVVELSPGRCQIGSTMSDAEALDRDRRFGVDRILSRRRIPLVAALEALPEIAAGLGELHLGADVAALRTDFGHRLVPDDEIARPRSSSA